MPWLPLLASIAIYITNIIVVGVHGNFPLNDDYVYGLSVKHFLEAGQFEFFVSCSACYLHTLIGSAAASLFGFSFEVLRCVTLLTGLIALITVYLILRELNVGRQLSGLAACIFAANPLVVNLQFTYMTDILALTLSSLSILFMVRGLKKASPLQFILAGSFLALSVLVRQSCIVIAAANLALFLALCYRRKTCWSVLSMGVMLPLLALAVSQLTMPMVTENLEPYRHHKRLIGVLFDCMRNYPFLCTKFVLVKTSQVMAYLSLFCCPLIIGFLRPTAAVRVFRSFNLLHFSAIAVLVALIVSALRHNVLMPYCPNIWKLTELGSLGLIGQRFELDAAVRYLFTFLVILLAPVLTAILASGLKQAMKNFSRKSESCRLPEELYLHLVLISTVAFATLNVILKNLDRYTLDAFVPVLVCVCLAASRFRAIPATSVGALPAAALVLLIGYISLSQEYCYMNWNRARWTAIHSLENRNIAATSIDGGAEHVFLRDVIGSWSKFKITNERRYHLEPEDHGTTAARKYRWWPVQNDDYIVSFVDIPGHKTISKFPFKSLSPWRFREILILKRDTGDGSIQEVKQKLTTGGSSL